jgi:hypothetical protein
MIARASLQPFGPIAAIENQCAKFHSCPRCLKVSWFSFIETRAKIVDNLKSPKLLELRQMARDYLGT